MGAPSPCPPDKGDHLVQRLYSMTYTDARFLQPGERVARWFRVEQPECLRCTHCDVWPEHGGMRCRAAGRKGRVPQMFCIDAREEGGPCGPTSKLFKEKR